MWTEVKVTQSCPTLCNPMDYTLHGILKARILEWVAFPFSRGFSQPRNPTQVSCIAGRFFISWATGKPKKTGVSSLSTRWVDVRACLLSPTQLAGVPSPARSLTRVAGLWWGSPLGSLLDQVWKVSYPHHRWGWSPRSWWSPSPSHLLSFMLASMWDESNCAVVWAFFGIAFLLDWNENWSFPVLWPPLSFPNLLAYWVQHFHHISF